jgi:hypothetical protein
VSTGLWGLTPESGVQLGGLSLGLR